MANQTDPVKKRRAMDRPAELVIITGLSGSGKGSVLKALEDLGYYSVDNLPVDLIPKFAELTQDSATVRAAALVVDVREGEGLKRFPGIYMRIRNRVKARLVFLEADDNAILRRFSETRRPHPLGTGTTVRASLGTERRHLRAIRKIADLVIDTTKFNVHELRAHLTDRFKQQSGSPQTILVSCVSFGYKHGLPEDADLVFDVRFLPNPHFVPEFRGLTGRDPRVAKYIRSFPQTQEFINRISELLIYLLPHYIREGKSYLTISFGCTGGQHRSVMIAEDVSKRLRKAGHKVKVVHRDSPK
jgi:UPF0042 nucleotide-binding protein